jgi:hypothetical protein
MHPVFTGCSRLENRRTSKGLAVQLKRSGILREDGYNKPVAKKAKGTIA